MSTRDLIAFLRSQRPDASVYELADAIWLASLGIFETRNVDRPLEPARRESKRDAPEAEADDRAEEELERIEKEATRGDSDRESEEDYDSADVSVPPSDPSELPSGPMTSRRGGVPLRTPGTRALPHARKLALALRPFRRTVPSRLNAVIDEQVTADRIAETRIRVPFLLPARARQFEMAFVIDESPSMILWRDVLRELRRLLEQIGGFRDVRSWWLDTSTRDAVILRAKPQGPARKPGELIAPDGKRLLLILSDCVQPAWEGRGARDVIALWGKRQAVAILQLLPQTLWRRTALDPARGVTYLHVGATAPGVPNRALVRRAWRAPRGSPMPEGVAVPVLTTQPQFFGAWAKLLHTAGAPQMPAVILPSDSRLDEQTIGNVPDSAGPTGDAYAWNVNSAVQHIRQFQAASSPLAFGLAQLLAAAPLRLPVIRLVQQALLPQSDQTHLAEFFLSGLIYRVTQNQTADPEQTDFDFFPQIRGLLLDTSRAADAVAVQIAVSRYIGERFGRILDFEAILAAPESVAEVELASVDQVFARVSGEVLMRLGGRYARVAERLIAPGKRKRDTEVAAFETDSPLHGARILWVDDQPYRNARAVEELRIQGADVVPVESTDEALVHFGARNDTDPDPFDVVISDIDRPESPVAGLLLLDSLRGRDHFVPVAIYSVDAATFSQRALDRGAFVCSNVYADVLEALRVNLQQTRAIRRKPISPPLPERCAALLRDRLREFSLGTRLNDADPHKSTAGLLAQLEANWESLWMGIQAERTQRIVWTFLPRIVEAAMGAQSVGIWRVEPRTRDSSMRLTVIVTHGDRHTLSEEIAGRVVSARNTVHVPATASRPAASEVAVPVSSDGGFGIVNVVARPSYAFTSRQLLWLEMLARSMAPLFSGRKAGGSVELILDTVESLRQRDVAEVVFLRCALRLAMLIPLRRTPQQVTAAVRFMVEFAEIWITRPQPRSRRWEAVWNSGARPADDAQFADPIAACVADFAVLALMVRRLDMKRFGSLRRVELPTLGEHLSDLPELVAPAIRSALLRDLQQVERDGIDPANLLAQLGPLWPDRSVLPDSVTASIVRKGDVVLVAGSAAQVLPSDLGAMAEWLGYVLAAAGFRIVCGNWPGVDRAVSGAFVDRLRVWGGNLRTWMSQVIEPPSKPMISGTRVIETVSSRDAIETSVENADCVVLLDGGPGTLEIGRFALERGLPVVVLAHASSDVSQLVSQKQTMRYRNLLIGDLSADPFVTIANLPATIRHKLANRPKRAGWRWLETPSREKSARFYRQQGVLSFKSPHRNSYSTAFVLNDPRVIVVDSADLEGARLVTLTDAQNTEHDCEVIDSLPPGVHGPAFLAVPESLSVEGLLLSDRPVLPQTMLRALSAGDEPWASVIARISERAERPIKLTGRFVGKHVIFRAMLDGSASGAPLLDSGGRVRGMIVGRNDESGVRFCLPANTWIMQAYAAAGRSAAEPIRAVRSKKTSKKKTVRKKSTKRK